MRFSPLALACVVALAATGVLQALIDMGWSLSALTDTPFGRAVLIKVALLVALVGARRGQPPARRARACGGWPTAASRPARPAACCGAPCAARSRSLVVVLGVTSALVELRAAGREPRAARIADDRGWGRSSSQTTVDPARVGANQMHVYLFDAQDRRGVHEDQGADACTAALPEQEHRAARR